MILLLTTLLTLGDTVTTGPPQIHPDPDFVDQPASVLRRVEWSEFLSGPALPVSVPKTITPSVLPVAPQLFEYSDGYATRARIHRIASYATLPLFAAEYVTGTELFNNRENPADWAKSTHSSIAGALGVLFAVNTVTGVWNLVEARHDPEGRKRRTVHAALLLASDLGIALAGATAEEAEDGGSADTHRTIALTSLGTALAGYLMMTWPFRRD